MSVERLICALWTEAELKERAIMEEAQETIGKITAAREESVSRLDIQIESRKKYLALSEEALGSAHETMRKRKAQLYAVAGAMKTVRDAAKALFLEFMKSPAYPAYLLRQIEFAKKESGAIGAIRADTMTAQALRKAGVPNVGDDVTVENGFIAVMDDGKTRIFCLLDTQLEKLWKEAAPRLVAQITEAVAHGD
jgi:lysyl-tRNA synthetase class II